MRQPLSTARPSLTACTVTRLCIETLTSLASNLARRCSVAIRRWLAATPAVARELFGAERLPSLLQYDPCCRLLEHHKGDGSLVVSAVGTPHTAAPLLRYRIGDAGGLISYDGGLAFEG